MTDATVYINGIAVIRFPATVSTPPGGLAPAQRLAQQITVDSRLLTSGINIAAIAYRDD